ncbi:hypothetical protein [Paenibacillus rigui]|uniref:Uncharacterized protein n=1 Tax=Paenibacillus rigui TaxID=554312 RepID=A0A229UKY5_9BACL|nr:hypothetical protein [Paenibacillus rigui]OXM83965.1 hypothetical protein CF651_22900 [Paenibacillus rigui]
MNLGQILNEVKLLVPPSADITDEQLVLKINQLQRRIYRELQLPDKLYYIKTTPASPFYDLPIDCPEDRISTVLVNNEAYDKSDNQDDVAPSTFWTIMTGSLYLRPNPTTELDLLIYYKPRYHDLVASNTSDISDLPEDYHELLVYGCAQWVASTLRDVDMVNNMQMEYDSLLRDAKNYLMSLTDRNLVVNERW